MNKLLLYTPGALGLAVVAWIGASYLPDNPLALALVLAIGGFFGVGVAELLRFDRATTAFAAVLDATREAPPTLGDWLQRLPAGLRDAARLRVEGERVALPGPALAPYLAGLLVLLGMLGTFLGMVVTLRGTGLALENAGDVQAIRATLAAPVKGLGLAFGCSVAGVAASAALGLMSALVRRERLRLARALDAAIAGPLRGFSRSHQREEALRLLQAQTSAVSSALPALATQIETLVVQLQRQGQALNEGLLAGQSAFHAEARANIQGLAASVDRTLQQALVESARVAGQTLQPAVQSTLAGLAQESAALQRSLEGAVQRQIDGIAAKLDASAALTGERWQAAFEVQQRESEARSRELHAGLERFAQTFEQRSTALVEGVGARLDAGVQRWTAGFEQHAQALLRGVGEAHAELDAASAAREAERLATFHAGLAGITDEVQRHARASAEVAAAREQQIGTTLEATARRITEQAAAQAAATLAEITKLLDAAAQAPRAAADVIGELRSALSDSLVRDNAALDERNRLLATLSGLLDAVDHASREQRHAIDTLVAGSGALMERLGARFEASVDAGTRSLQDVAVQLGGSAAEVASLGEGFGAAVQRFGDASGQLAAQLQRIEAALAGTLARSDEQLAYYVAQAREIVDLTIGSQKQVIDELQQLARAPRRAAEAAAG